MLFSSPADEFGDPGVTEMVSIQQSGCGSLALKARKQEFSIGLNTSKETEWWLRIDFWASFLPLSSSFFFFFFSEWEEQKGQLTGLRFRHPSGSFCPAVIFFNFCVWELLLCWKESSKNCFGERLWRSTVNVHDNFSKEWSAAEGEMSRLTHSFLEEESSHPKSWHTCQWQRTG